MKGGSSIGTGQMVGTIGRGCYRRRVMKRRMMKEQALGGG
jgi:hypothetical protein